jgi:hypothetical protein
MSSHPGSNLDDAIQLAQYLRENRITPQQVQDFYPTPGTLATAMYYSGYDPRTLKPVYSAKTSEDKKLQRALLHAHIPENRYAVIDALKKAGREDLIGSSPECIITARAGDKAHKNKQPASGKTAPVRGGKPAAKSANGRRSDAKPAARPAAKPSGKSAPKSAPKSASAPRSTNKSAPKSQKGKRK